MMEYQAGVMHNAELCRRYDVITIGVVAATDVADGGCLLNLLQRVLPASPFDAHCCRMGTVIKHSYARPS